MVTVSAKLNILIYPEQQFQYENQINVGNLWKLSKDLISREGHHRWFWGIRISYLRYVNYLQPWLHRDKYGLELWKIFRSGAWLLTWFKAVRYGNTKHYLHTAIYLLKAITVTSEKHYYDYLRHCCVDYSSHQAVTYSL